MRILVTGGAGFMGSNFVRHLLREHSDHEVINLDKLTYAGNIQSLSDVQRDPRYRFVRADIGDSGVLRDLLAEGVEAVVNFACESHVDRSILNAAPFVEANVKGTQILLEAVRRRGVRRFLQVSTGEVYGSIEYGKWTEDSRLSPSSPYAASKAAGDLLCNAYWRTYGVPVLVGRCSNSLGPWQFPEKFVPLVITNALEDRPIPVYGDGLNVRDWVYVEDHCRALDLVLQKGEVGEVYNIGGGSECTNLEVGRRLLDMMNKPQSLMTFVSDRPGHDRRYALDTARLRRELGFVPAYTFEEALSRTVEWYVSHETWWRNAKSGEYVHYYGQVYSGR